jgi:hypothetical protein
MNEVCRLRDLCCVVFRWLDGAVTFASHKYECGDDATHARFNFREEFQSPDNRSHLNEGVRAFFVFQQLSRSCGEMTRHDHSRSWSVCGLGCRRDDAFVSDCAQGDSQEEIQKIDDRAPTILQASNAAGLETGGARSPGGCRESALPAKSRAISTRSGAASAYGHTPGTLDLANGLPLLGEDSDK